MGKKAKQVRVTPHIEDRDLVRKIGQIQKWLEKGLEASMLIQIHGRNKAYTDNHISAIKARIGELGLRATSVSQGKKGYIIGVVKGA